MAALWERPLPLKCYLTLSCIILIFKSHMASIQDIKNRHPSHGGGNRPRYASGWMHWMRHTGLYANKRKVYKRTNIWGRQLLKRRFFPFVFFFVLFFACSHQILELFDMFVFFCFSEFVCVLEQNVFVWGTTAAHLIMPSSWLQQQDP